MNTEELKRLASATEQADFYMWSAHVGSVRSADVLELIAERDELLAALEKIIGLPCSDDPEKNGFMELIVTGAEFRAARAAIAKAKGGAA